MTAVLDRPAGDQNNLWSSMPGWGIVADLTPPEFINERKLRVLRRYIALALALVAVTAAAGWFAAFLKSSAASNDLAGVRSEGNTLIAQQAKYRDVTRLQAANATIRAQTSSVMAHEVDVAGLVAKLRDVLPTTMSLTTITTSLNLIGPPAASGPTSLDRSGAAIIGSVSLSGSSQTIVDLASYVSSLSQIKGVVNVIPTSNAATSAGSTTFNVSLQVTDQLYTNRYRPSTASTTGGNR